MYRRSFARCRRSASFGDSQVRLSGHCSTVSRSTDPQPAIVADFADFDADLAEASIFAVLDALCSRTVSVRRLGEAWLRVNLASHVQCVFIRPARTFRAMLTCRLCVREGSSIRFSASSSISAPLVRSGRPRTTVDASTASSTRACSTLDARATCSNACSGCRQPTASPA